MAAYCRVSTDQEEQLSSYENQVSYYTNFISNNPQYELAGIYADEGISGTNTKKRKNFNRMIDDCEAGKIDRIIVKSISRFARNTLDCLNYVRRLKELGIGVTFEKEAIDTLDAKGEVLLTILSSLAQDESRSISENSTWGIRKRFEQGKFSVNTRKFMGYDSDESGNLIVNEEQAKIVRMIYEKYLCGRNYFVIARELNEAGIPGWNGKVNWIASTIEKMLHNEKYKGDALLQKTYTVDFLTKKREKNQGQIAQYYVENNHPAIVKPEIWEAVQLEEQRRREYMKLHHIKAYSSDLANNPFASKIICGECGEAFGRKKWRPRPGEYRSVWQCNARYRVKGVMGCANRHIDESTLEEIFVKAYGSFDLSSTVSYPSDGEHYRIIKLATESTASCQHLKSIIKVDGIPLSKITLKDDFSVDVNGVKYTFSLSSILPSHTNSSKLAMITDKFKSIAGYEKVFAQNIE